MNRWSRWARQLRLRHGRTVLLGGGAAMVLARRPAVGAATFRAAGSPVHISLYPRFGVTLAVTAPAPLSTAASGVLATGARAPVSRRAELVHKHRTDSFQTQLELVPRWQPRVLPGGSPAAAVHIPDLKAPAARRRFVETPVRYAATSAPQPQSLYWRTRMWTRKPSAARAAVDLPGRLRVRTRRIELAAPAIRELVAAAPFRREISSAATQAGYQSSAPPTLPDAAPAINVEALASQVIQQMDRRLIAYRERMGRG